MDVGGHGAERAEVSRGGCRPAEQQEQHRHRRGRQGRLGGECVDSCVRKICGKFEWYQAFLKSRGESSIGSDAREKKQP